MTARPALLTMLSLLLVLGGAVVLAQGAGVPSIEELEKQLVEKEKQQADRQQRSREAAREKALQQPALAGVLTNMVTIPAGEFRMGDSAGDGSSGEKPVHVVRVRGFKLGRTEVTFDQYDAYAQATGRPLPTDSGFGRGNRPVINVSWDDAQAYIAWLNQQTGQRFRLPSEAEWEYAARAGSTSKYPWGNEFSGAQANGAGAQGKTTPVAQYPANRFGLHDMIGNVWEWTQDCYNGSYAGAPGEGSAWTSGDCSRRVYRGGSWNANPAVLRVSDRDGHDASFRLNYLGFRLAQDL